MFELALSNGDFVDERPVMAVQVYEFEALAFLPDPAMKPG